MNVLGPITHDVLPSPSVLSCWTLSSCSSALGMYRVGSVEAFKGRDYHKGHFLNVHGGNTAHGWEVTKCKGENKYEF